ncbi:predicted protein [Uncinocarpus reesii 1704]|uniref:DASH complex subunit DAD1 n=1 Tax=Uncinocarpus reesii (strain UAMH 1704) TaxID=336963 RepID=C4JDB2_UNCRE|nr:uncharacterized protein UREG_00339 [Uncinocarpus reesii 1704]EEP75493.1 predicted protein [Uncinocarpus reesii 1704]
MSSSQAPGSASYFEQQRAELLREISLVGNEFSSVEALWSQFETVMAKDEGSGDGEIDHDGAQPKGQREDRVEVKGEEDEEEVTALHDDCDDHS